MSAEGSEVSSVVTELLQNEMGNNYTADYEVASDANPSLGSQYLKELEDGCGLKLLQEEKITKAFKKYCAIASLALSVTSFADTSYLGCRFARLGTSTSVSGLTCALEADTIFSGKYKCNSFDYVTNAIGSSCSKIISQGNALLITMAQKSTHFSSMSTFVALYNVLCGMIITLWLLFSTYCPILASHKLALIVLTIWACAFQVFAFLFCGNLICQENGCILDQGGYIRGCQCAGTVIYWLFVSIFSVILHAR